MLIIFPNWAWMLQEGSECSSVTSESMAGGGGATATAGVSHQASTSPMSNSGGGHPGGGGGNSGRITLETVYVQLQTRKRDVDALSEKIDYVRVGSFLNFSIIH